MSIELDEAKRTLLDMKEKIVDLGSALQIEETKKSVEELESKTSAADFWNDAAESGKVLKELKVKKDKVERYDRLVSRYEDTLVLIEMALEEGDDSVTEEVLSEVKVITETEASERIEALLSGEYDSNNAILSFHPGAGGTEAQDWAQMLYRMYTRWAERHNFKVKLIDWLDGDEAGIKSATILIEGINAYGYLKSENGVHRLVRVSPFDASGRRQTSFASVEVMPEFSDDDGKIELRDEDLEITAHRSSGAGGQHINKTESAIRIIHHPTGVVVECQEERSQYKNKDKAMKMLYSKLYEMKLNEQMSKIAAERKIQVGTGDRSERIRTYNYPQSRVTDHRIGLTLYKLEQFLNGDCDEVFDALAIADRTAKLSRAEAND